MVGGVAVRYFEGGGGNIRGGDARAGKFVRQCYRNAAGACAYIGDAMRGIALRRRVAGCDCQALQDDFDYVFGFWTRDQDIGCDFEVQTPEFLMAGEVLRRDAARAPRDQGEVSLASRRFEFLFRMRVEPCAVAPQRVHQEQFSSQWRGGNVLAFELSDGVAEGGAKRRDS